MKDKDIRMFLDGIYVSEKTTIDEAEAWTKLYFLKIQIQFVLV